MKILITNINNQAAPLKLGEFYYDKDKKTLYVGDGGLFSSQEAVYYPPLMKAGVSFTLPKRITVKTAYPNIAATPAASLSLTVANKINVSMPNNIAT